MKPKIIAMYLPQFHQIPENDEFWGEGFTDWVTVKNARPLFKGHQQPRVPLNNNYYDLSIKESVEWQCKLAHEHGIYGFGVYHYWFNNETNLLTKPAEIIRDNDDVKINYFFAWDNANWIRSWSNVAGNDWSPVQDKIVNDNLSKSDKTKILVPYILGGQQDWEIHYRYVLGHFKSSKYIKIDNKPLFIIYNYSDEIEKMCKYWDELARLDGFDGMYFIMKYKQGITDPNIIRTFKYEPINSGWYKRTIIQRIKGRLRSLFNIEPSVRKFSYDKIWDRILLNAQKDSNPNIFHGGFVCYDDTPRRGNRGTAVLGATPEKFGFYLKKLLEISASQRKEYVFITAWNEWGEGAILEPDIENKSAYLEEIDIS